MVDVMLSWCLELKEAVMTLQSFARRTCMSCPGLKREHARIRPLRRRNGKGGMSIHADLRRGSENVETGAVIQSTMLGEMVASNESMLSQRCFPRKDLV